jgi:antitoxin component YwqK of YwqJK toxin-antitoxin module
VHDGITIRYTQNRKIGIAIRYAQNRKIGITIRYAQNRKIGKPYILKFWEQ